MVQSVVLHFVYKELQSSNNNQQPASRIKASSHGEPYNQLKGSHISAY